MDVSPGDDEVVAQLMDVVPGTEPEEEGEQGDEELSLEDSVTQKLVTTMEMYEDLDQSKETSTNKDASTNDTEDVDPTEDDGKETDRNVKFSEFPISKIKKIMKLDPEVNIVSHEAALLTAKATVCCT